MKNGLKLFLAVAAAVVCSGMLPFTRNDVAQLVPVEALVVSLDNERIVLDGGECRGSGDTWEKAWEGFYQSAEGTVFLGTMEYVVLSGGAVRFLPEIVQRTDLRPAAGVCAGLGETPGAKDAAAYLAAHETGVTLQQVRAAYLRESNVALPVLIETKGGLRLYGPDGW